MPIGPNLENQGSVRYWSKSALSSNKWQKRAPQILPPHIRTSFYVFGVKIKLCIIFTKRGRVRKPVVFFCLDYGLVNTESLQVEYGMIYSPDMYSFQVRK